MIRLLYIWAILGCCSSVYAQYNWKLDKDQDGIRIYSASVPNLVFKAIKVETDVKGDYTKLISILTNVPRMSEWVYNARNCKLLQLYSKHDFVYYSETAMPWPLSNRDVIIRLQVNTDSLPRFVTITGTGEPTRLPQKPGLVRVVYYKARWKLTMPEINTLRIEYTVEVDPGGSLPGWIANMFGEKGPFETFTRLTEKMKQ
jgi:hypothetical protein